MDKVRDTVGLYMVPPDRALADRALADRALVLCVDEKPSTQATECTAPVLVRGLDPGMHPSQVGRSVPRDLDVHLVLDNAATHRARPSIAGWRNGRATTCTSRRPSESWLNLVEAWFAQLTARQLRCGSFHGTRALEQAIRRDIASTNENPKPFVWTKSADDSLASVQRFCQRASNSDH